MFKVLLFTLFLLQAAFAENGYYFNFSNSAPYNCYFGSTARSCAANCDYYSAIPPEYCSLMPTLGGCSPGGCPAAPSGTRTFCAGCPTAPQYQCQVDGSTPINCTCALVPIPLSNAVCNSTGTFDGVAVADGASMNLYYQFESGTLSSRQSITDITNGTMLVNAENQGVLQFSSAVYRYSSFYSPANVSCAYDGVNFASFNSTYSRVNFNCDFSAFVAATNVTTQATGSGFYFAYYLRVIGESTFTSFKESTPICNGTGLSSSAYFYQLDTGHFIVSAPSNATVYGVMDLTVRNSTLYFYLGSSDPFYEDNTASFPDGSYQNHAWTRADTVTSFNNFVYYHVATGISPNDSYFTIIPDRSTIRPFVVTNCSINTIMNFYGYASYADQVVCDLAGFNSTLTANMTANSTILPDGSLLVPGGSQVVSGNMTVDVAANNTDLEALFVMYLNPLDIVNNSVLISEYFDSYLIDFGALKATLVDPVAPAVNFLDESIDLGHGKWLVCNNTYFTSEGVLLIGDLINITAGSYLALSQPNDLVSYITIATDYSYNACITSLALISGTTVTCLLNSTTKSTNAFEEQYSIYLNEGGTLDPATGDIILVNGSHDTLQFNGDNVTWYFNNNTAFVPTGVPIQAVNPTADPTVFDEAVFLTSDGTVYNTNGQVLGHFDADGNYQPPIPPIPSPPLPVIPEQCKNTSMNLFIVNRKATCAAFGWTPAAVSSTNYNAVSNLIYNCGLPGSRAAIGSWEGYDFNADFITNYLVFTVGYSSGGSGDVSVATITDGIPFVCQSN